MSVRITPLGGLGEFGMNCCAVEHGDDIVVIDAGLMFPDETAPGVDVIIPEMQYLFENRDRLRGVLLTHAHEDHTGALPYLLREVNVPVYGTRLTLALIQGKLEEHEVGSDRRLIEVSPRDRVSLGSFEIEFLRVSHSVSDAVGLAIRTASGTIIHTGDFKIDTTPFLDESVDMARFAAYGEEGVLALLSDSTNAEQPGCTGSESSVRERLREIFAGAGDGRIFVTCFATSLPRIQHVLDLAAERGRRVALLGRAMRENIDISSRLGYLNVPQGLLMRKEDVSTQPPGSVLVLATGSQGEPLSAMNRISMRDYPHARVDPGDTVVMSARVIPGNEKGVSRIINRLVRQGAKVYHQAVADVHVSGHASQEELKLMASIVRPRYFIPVHGEFRQLYAHADLARQVGIPDDRIILAESGDVIELSEDSARIVGRVEVGRVFIDIGGYGEVEESILRDRKHLSADGIVVVVMAIEKGSGTLQGSPEIIIRGMLDLDPHGFLRDAADLCATVVSGAPVEERQDWAAVKEKLRREVRRFFHKRFMKRPMIIPVIMEV